MEKSCFGREQGKVCAKERLLVCENGNFLRTAKKGTCKKKFLCVKTALSEVCKAFCKWKTFGFAIKAFF